MARDSFTNPVSSGGSTTTTQSVNVASVADRKLLVWVRAPSARTFTVARDGQSTTTPVASAAYNFDSLRFALYVIDAPNVGTSNLVVTADTGATFVTQAEWWNGVDSAFDATTIATGFSAATSQTMGITTVTANAYTTMGASVGSGNPAAGTGSTLINTPNVGMGLFGAGPHVTPGAVSMQYTMTSSVSAAIIAALKPAAGAPPQVPPFSRGWMI